MSGSVNKALVIGNLGQDPDVRSSNQGTKIVNLSIATSETWKDKSSGERKERTTWHRVVIFGGMDSDGAAGVAEKYLRKGSKCMVEGAMQTRKWTDQQGVDRYTTEIVVKPFNGNLVLLDRKEGSGPPPASSEDDYGNTSSRPGKPEGQPAGDVDDDLPF